MIEFSVEDMTCKQCAGTITDAIRTADPNATVEVNLTEHFIRIESELAAEDLEVVIRNMGYTPVTAPPASW